MTCVTVYLFCVCMLMLWFVLKALKDLHLIFSCSLPTLGLDFMYSLLLCVLIGFVMEILPRSAAGHCSYRQVPHYSISVPSQVIEIQVVCVGVEIQHNVCCHWVSDGRKKLLHIAVLTSRISISS